MADNLSAESSSTSEVSGENSDSTVQLNVKTLDSQIYSFHVNTNMPVSVFKEKIAAEVGLPVVQQRLIFRGKVLKDEHLLSEYYVEDGHTLHLVARQPTQSQPSAGTSSGETDANNGNDASAGGPRNRVGQISHSVVLGTFNVGDQGEGGVPDLGRVIGAVLNSFGIGGQSTTIASGTTQSSGSSNPPGQVPLGNLAEGIRGNVAGQNQAGNQAHSGQTFPSQQFHLTPQVMQIPLSGAAVPLPSLHSPIPDSLNTMSEFMNRMELAFSQNGNQPNSSTNAGDRPTLELPSNARGLPTPEALSIVLRHAQRLLNDHAIVAQSHLAGRLEQEGASTDPIIRGQIQTESMQLGLAMQHLGALFLELGRSILTLRMGQSPAESFVNAGPAIYISPLGPNPLMVQPFPLQTSSLFGGSAISSNTGTSGPVGTGNVPRHINIHIHAGTSLEPNVSAVGGANNEEGMVGEHASGPRSGNTGPTRVQAVRNVIATAIPARPIVVATSGAAQPGVGVSNMQPPPDSDSLSAVVAEVNSRIRNFVENMRGEPQAPSGNNVGNDQLNNMPVSSAVGTNVPLSGCTPQMEDQKHQPEGHQISNNEDTVGQSLKDVSTCSAEDPTSSSGEASLKAVDNSDDLVRSSERHNEAAQAVPIGLGLGGLQPKKRSKQPKSQVKGSDAATSTTSQNQNMGTSVRQVLQSLASQNSVSNRSNANQSQGPDVQSDPASIMSQVIQSPALDGLLSGVSEQAGVGSPDMLRNMLGQLTQNPVMRNAVNQIAQQVDSQDIGNMFSGFGGGQGGGFDLSMMVQQMMPIVSRALGSGSTLQESFPAVEAVPQPQEQDNGRRPSSQDKPYDQNTQIDLQQAAQRIDLQQAAQRIEHQNPPGDIFRAVAENAGRTYGIGNSSEELVEELCNDEDLANEFMKMLSKDVSRRFEDRS